MQNSDRYMQSKKFLSFIRKGDYAHAGEAEAIELALADVPKNPERNILDVGSGLGGTAHYIQMHGWGNVVGVDIEKAAISYAQEMYLEVEFHICDVMDVSDKLLGSQFDLMVIFNAFFSFADQTGALRELAKVTKSNAELIIFDYSCPDNHIPENPFPGGSVTSFNPFQPGKVENLLKENGWKLTKYSDVSPQLLKWYAELVERMEIYKEQALEIFGEENFKRMHTNFTNAHQLIQNKELGAVILTAKILT
jgi:phosphoethanolamine N-methyltransferase